jgi:hypothetical protein
MRGLLLLALLALAGCKPAEVALGVPPGFYPSAVAHDPVGDRFFIGSHATGEIAIVRRDGARRGLLRPEGAPQPIVQLAYDAGLSRLWALTSSTVEAIDLAGLPVWRGVIARAEPGSRFADLAVDDGARVFVLTTGGAIVAIDATRGGSARLAQLPGGEDEGSLALAPDRSTLVAARAGGLWRVAAATGAVERIALDAPLADVSQLLVATSEVAGFQVAAFRGRANEVVTLYLTPDARRATVDAGTRVRYDTPFHGAADGRNVIVLLGRLRHHPDFGGDGRPNLPPRLAIYSGHAAGSSMAAAPASALLR